MSSAAGFTAGHLEGIGVRKFLQPVLLRSEACSSSTCAWRSSRALSGFLASTPQTQPGECALRSRFSPHRGECLRTGKKDHKKKFGVASCCASSSDDAYVSSCNITPITLWKSLKPTISYLIKAQLRMVKDGLKLAFEAHDGQKGKSREPFIIHPVEVARILRELVLFKNLFSIRIPPKVSI